MVMFFLQITSRFLWNMLGAHGRCQILPDGRDLVETERTSVMNQSTRWKLCSNPPRGRTPLPR